LDPSKVKIEIPQETPEEQREESAPPDFGAPAQGAPQKKPQEAPADDLQKQFGGK
jgi:hypothetical protein